MTPPFFYALLSVLGVSLLSLLGVLFFIFDDHVTKRALLFLVSMSTGALLGDVFIHIVPELAEHADTFQRDLFILLGGILFSFALEKLIHWRHCHVLPSAHHSQNEHGEDQHHHHCHPVGIINLVAESLHNFIDGLVIASAFIAGISVGISTAIAVALHEIPHEIGNVAVLLHSGYPRRKALLFNALSAGASIVGAVIILATSVESTVISRWMLPFAAGNLLYIAGSDLIPELHKETRLPQALGQLLCIILGMAMMYGITLME